MLIILSIAMIVADVRYSLFTPVRLYFTWLVAPIQVIAYTPHKIFYWTTKRLQNREDLVKENQFLNQEVLILRSRLQKLLALQAENVRLRELMDASQQVGEKVVMAEVIGFDQNPYSYKILIDKGFSSDAYIGQPVLDATGVFGQVVETSAYTSRVLLITDTSHFLPAQLSRTGFTSVLRGGGDLKHMQLISVPHSADIKKGDILTTSGLDKYFPSGYPVGIVRSVKHVPGERYADVDVMPLAQLGRSRHVMLIEKPKLERQ